MLENILGRKSFLRHIFSKYFLYYHFILFFLVIPVPVPGYSQEWKPLIPFPELWEWIFSFPSHSRIMGMDFFHSLPVPELWEWFFSFPSRSQIVGMDFFHSLPVPELWEWVFSIPFPFPNFTNGFFDSRSRSRSPKSHSRSPLHWLPSASASKYQLCFEGVTSYSTSHLTTQTDIQSGRTRKHETSHTLWACYVSFLCSGCVNVMQCCFQKVHGLLVIKNGWH